ncbi:unnamed protein product [Caenorhabditis sp. 36 PRJEB53466]|nr:unnamed protein product [Caenorhabditis sp. 36 PRJEB53466]
MRKDGLWKAFVLFRTITSILPATSFDLDRYYNDRLVIREFGNSSAFYTTAQSRKEAEAHLSIISPNCTFPSDVQEYTCEHIDNDFCEYNRKKEEEGRSRWKSYGYVREGCHCDLEICGEEAGLNSTRTVLYPGCTCDEEIKNEQCNFNISCPFWYDKSDHDDLGFNVIPPKSHNTFKNFIQAGTADQLFHKKTISLKSVPFRQSGINCTLRFMHHFAPQSPLSKLVVRAHLEKSGEAKILYEFATDTEKISSSIRWQTIVLEIGSFSQPFHLSIDCETGAIPKKWKNKEKEEIRKMNRSFFVCSLAKIQFDSCVDIRNPVERCLRGDQLICSTPTNTRCLADSECDIKEDCEDGSDEAHCDSMVRGSMCDFSKVCDGWYQTVRISDYQENQFEPTTVAPLNKLEETPISLLRIKFPSSKLSVTREARRGSGPLLLYESVEARKLSRRTAVMASPRFPRTNPEAYNPDSKFFGSCKLRFYVCARTYSTTWSLSIISKMNNPLDSGRTHLYESRAFEETYVQAAVCEWQRTLVPVPRQNDAFRLGIFVDHQFDRDDFFALDDLSFSPSCFEKNSNQSTWEIPDLLISTCGASGFERPHDCNSFRALDGQTGHFMKEDGTQEWTVPVTGFYRIEACGAGGGSTDRKEGQKGECLTLQVHLLENIALRMLIGHMGESPCVAELNEELKPASCAKTSAVKQKSRDGGAGGGGATLIQIESNVWNVIVGGGAGASWNSEDTKAGYGASQLPVDIDDQCTTICRAVSHTEFIIDKNVDLCPKPNENQTTVFGGFGGGGNSCGMLGGSGAGYKGGNPFGKGRERSGTSNVTENFSKDVGYYQAMHVEDGFIKISFCRTLCTPPSVCRFKGDSFAEEFCGCPDGSDFTNTSGSCACSLGCPAGATCLYRNFTSEPFCMCGSGKFIEDLSNDFCEGYEGWTWHNYVLLLFIIFLVIGSVIAVTHYRNRTNKMKHQLLELKYVASTFREMTYDDVYFGNQTRKEAVSKLPTLDRNVVEIGNIIGKGNFGEVFSGNYNEHRLAIKTISKAFGSTASAQDFQARKYRSTDRSGLRLSPVYDFIEYMEGGDLLSFVKDARPNQVSLNPFHLTMADLLRISYDVAAGCRCLEEYGYVHRDIAARNILLTERGAQRVAKIADFGMAKAINKYGSEYYRVHGRAMLPIKWTPPESFIDGVFTTKSDIWSYGILCWEIFSLGVVPYPNRRNEEVMLMLTEGGRLEYPYGIPTRVYQLMRECWRTSSSDRPSFAHVVETLMDILSDSYAVGMPFPIHPTVRAKYAHAQSTPVSVETPQTAVTDISASSVFPDASTVKVTNTQQDIQDRITLHEIMLTRELPYSSEMTACVVDNLRKDLARSQFELGMTSVPQPKYLSPDSIDESIQLIPNGNTVQEQTPPTSMVDLNRLAVQDTGPTLHRPDSLNISDYYCSVPLLEIQTT